MGYSHIHMVVYGYRVPYNTIDEYREEPVKENNWHTNIAEYRYDNISSGDTIVVMDGKNGDYGYVGIAQYIGDQNRGAPSTIPNLNLVEPRSPAQMVEVGQLLAKMDYEPTGEPTHHVFTHTV